MKQETKDKVLKTKKKQEADAKKDILQELFYDLYSNRVAVYRMNFIRGVFFGLGSVLGGTVLIAFVIWLLTQLSGVIPGLGDFFEAISRALEKPDSP